MQLESKEQIAQYLLKLIESQRGGYSCAINALKIVAYNKDYQTRRIIDAAIVQTPDGFGAVLAYRLLYRRKIVKLDLPGLVLELANAKRLRLYLIGTTEENNHLSAENIQKAYKGIHLIGRHHGFFETSESIDRQLRLTKPHIVMIGMGSPRQELISAELLQQHPQILFIGCGGRLDILAGKLHRAPDIFIRFNIEWLYRLVRQPKRFRSQLELFTFLKLLAKDYFFHKRLTSC
jgi:N-acetylglucosaminyldiphosphoundecaprenol N-acetyl-beta-D-mannosaminyltransferase